MEYLSKLGRWIQRIYKNYYFLVILAVGLLLIYLNSFLNNETVAFLGSAILTSGIFTTALKTFQFTEIFKEELGKVISSSEFLENLKEKRLIQLWTDASQIICQRRFPEIANELFAFIKDNYFLTNLEYYYPEIQLTIELDYFEGKNNLVVSKETSLIKIKAVDTGSITYRFGSMIDKAMDLEMNVAYKLKEFYVNGEKKDLNPVPVDHSEGKWIVSQDVILSGKDEYTIIKKEERVESLKTNSDFLSFKIGRLTKKMQFNVKNNTKLTLDYVPFGTIGEFVDNTEALKLHGYDLSKESTGFVMIGQGFAILLK